MIGAVQPTPSSILIVEDDQVTREKMQAYFETEGYIVSTAATAEESRHILENHQVDIALLDINLPDGDGLSLARNIRARSDIGIIFVSGRDDDVDRIIGLEIGADDYVTKPFNPRELLARVKGLLRRTDQTQQQNGDIRKFSIWRFDTLRRTLQGDGGNLVDMTRAELELLELFTRYPGMTLSRERLMSRVTHRSWSPGDRTIDVLIRRLRQKLESDPAKPEIIKTIHGEGYMFCETVTVLSNSSAAVLDA